MTEETFRQRTGKSTWQAGLRPEPLLYRKATWRQRYCAGTVSLVCITRPSSNKEHNNGVRLTFAINLLKLIHVLKLAFLSPNEYPHLWISAALGGLCC